MAGGTKVVGAMSTFLRTDINLVAVILLGITYLGARQRLDRQDKLNRTYLAVSLIIMLELLLETATCYLNRAPGWRTMSQLLHVGLFATAPVLAYFWLQLVRFWVVPEAKLSRQSRLLTLTPAVCGVVLALLSPFYGFVFSLSETNVYHRGPLFPLAAAVVYLYMGCGMWLIVRQHRNTVREDVLPLFVFGSFSLLGGMVQSLFYGALLMWSSAAFSLVIVYSFLQQRMVHLDQMTGTWARASGERYLSGRMAHPGDQGFAVILFDMDDLKQINDHYGHLEGDRALRQAVELIRRVLRKSDVIARYGGDEFLIVADCDSPAELGMLMEGIRSSFAEFNRQTNLPYQLDCSIGGAIYDGSYTSIEQFLNHVDNLMYKQKRQKKSLQAAVATASAP